MKLKSVMQSFGSGTGDTGSITMGGSESKLKTFYNLNDLVLEGFFLNHYKATNKETGEIVSVFKSKSGILADNFDLLQTAIKKLKTIRHPGIYLVSKIRNH